MPQAKEPLVRVPFRRITGLPEQAQFELRRDFEELARLITAGVSLYDATIDPSLTSSNASTHQYKNITDFSVGEAAKLNPSRLLVVAIVGRPGTPVVETSNITLGGPVHFVGGGLDAPVSPGAGTARPQIDFAGHTITMSGGEWVTFTGLELTSRTGFIGILVTGRLALEDCNVNAVDVPGTSRTIGSMSSVMLFARNTEFLGNSSFSTITWAIDCSYFWVIAATSIGSSSGIFWWDGGVMDPITTGCGLAFSGTVTAYVRCALNAQLSGSASTNVPTVSLSSSGRCYINLQTLSNYPVFTVAAAAGDVMIEGAWSGMTVSGNTNNHERTFHGSCNGGILDVTGPALIDVDMTSLFSSSRVTLRGSGIRANLSFKGGQNPQLQLVACTESLVTASYVAPPPASQAYTIDAASARSVLVLSGTTHANFSVASTNASATCLVITEAGIPLAGAVGGSLTGTLPNPTFAGRDSSVDKINQDLLPALLIPQPGMATIPAATGAGGAPSGPAGGSLAGTYPNPTLAGRDSSVDKINQDLLPALLIPQPGLATIPAPGVSGTAVGGSLAGTLPNPTFAGRSSSVDELNKDMTQAFLVMGG